MQTMKIFFRSFIILTLFLMTSSAFAGERRGEYVIGFYNLENLFDTTHDEGKNDYEFLPDGNNRWTVDKYQKKLSNMAHAIRAMRDENKAYHTILGVAEVENQHVLEDLVGEKEIADAHYRFVHYDSPDERGIDVALLYRPDKFKLLESRPIPYDFNSDDIKFEKTPDERAAFKTRDALMVRGTIDGEMFAFFVAHLPSRLGDKGADLRERGAEIIYTNAVALMKKYPGIKIVVMGDMNDNPTDESMTTYMQGRENLADVGPYDFFSPFISIYKSGIGSLKYRSDWFIFDIIQVNYNLANAGRRSLKILPAGGDRQKPLYGRIFSAPFLTQQSGQYAGTPFRTFSNGAFINGYSDHYPTFIKIGK